MFIMNRELLKTLRRRTFSTPRRLNERLTQLALTTPSHQFLANPAAQNVYLYLVNYIRRLARLWFGTGLRNLRVLDWGCGKGQVTFLLREMGAAITSCDLVSDSSDSAFGQQTPIIDEEGIAIVPLKHENIIPFDSESFDIVLSIGVLEHVADDRKSLAEIQRILKPGGLFFCAFLPNESSWTQKFAQCRGDHYHDRFYNISKTMMLAKEAGLDVLDAWHRQIFPKNRIHYPMFRVFERIDQVMTEHTPLRALATNVEFLAAKPR
jgi:SAM-dependent methyltransferase